MHTHSHSHGSGSLFAQQRQIVLNYKPLLSGPGWNALMKAIMLAAINGLVQGFALLTLLPALTTLTTGEPVFGLTFGWWLAILGTLAGVGAALEYGQVMKAFIAALDLIQEVHDRLGDQIAKLPLGWFKADSPGVFSRLVSKEMMTLGEALAHMIIPFTVHGVAVVVMTVGSFFWNWRLGLVLLVITPLYWWMLFVGRSYLEQGKRVLEPTERVLAERLVEFSTCQGTIRACGLGSDYPEMRKAVDANYEAGRQFLRLGMIGNAIPGAVTQVLVVAMITVATILGIYEILSPVEAIAYIGMSLRFFDMLTAMVGNSAGMEDRRQTMEMIHGILSTPTLPEPGASRPLTRPGSVDLEDVHFAYVADKPVLQGVSAHIPANSLCAIVGPSGCGKTTIARLISRFYDVDRGVVKVGGVDVRELTTADLMGQLSMVFQDVYLFDDTLEANIRVGREGASDEEVLWAAKLAGVEEIVARLPHGFQTRVGEGGRSLSGGERQRVSVARALLKQAPVVLFDEATSALDAENEANIVASMEALREHATLIVIAHKLDTIRSADQVIVLNGHGHVAQVGTHEELIAQEGPYQGFWKTREQAAGWRLV